MSTRAKFAAAAVCFLGIVATPAGPASADTWNAFADPAGDVSGDSTYLTQAEKNQADIVKVGYGLNGSNNQNVWFRVTFKDLQSTLRQPVLSITANPVDTNTTDSLKPPRFSLAFDPGTKQWNLQHFNRLGEDDDTAICFERSTSWWDYNANFVQVAFPRDCFTQQYNWENVKVSSRVWSAKRDANGTSRAATDLTNFANASFVAGSGFWAPTVSRTDLKAGDHYDIYGTDVLTQAELNQSDMIRVGYGLNGDQNSRIWSRVTFKDLTPGLAKPTVKITAHEWETNVDYDMTFTPSTNTFKLFRTTTDSTGKETRSPYACSGMQFWWDFDANFVQVSYPRSCFPRDEVWDNLYFESTYTQASTGAYAKDDTFRAANAGPVAAGL